MCFLLFSLCFWIRISDLGQVPGFGAVSSCGSGADPFGANPFGVAPFGADASSDVDAGCLLVLDPWLRSWVDPFGADPRFEVEPGGCYRVGFLCLLGAEPRCFLDADASFGVGVDCLLALDSCVRSWVDPCLFFVGGCSSDLGYCSLSGEGADLFPLCVLLSFLDSIWGLLQSLHTLS